MRCAGAQHGPMGNSLVCSATHRHRNGVGKNPTPLRCVQHFPKVTERGGAWRTPKAQMSVEAGRPDQSSCTTARAFVGYRPSRNCKVRDRERSSRAIGRRRPPPTGAILCSSRLCGARNVRRHCAIAQCATTRARATPTPSRPGSRSVWRCGCASCTRRPQFLCKRMAPRRTFPRARESDANAAPPPSLFISPPQRRTSHST